MDQHPSAVVTPDTPLASPLYTTADVATMLRVSQRTVQEWIRAGTLTAVRYGRLLRIREADLVAFGQVLNPHPPTTDEADARPAAGPATAQPA